MNQESRYILVTSLNLCVFCFIVLQLDKCSAVDQSFVDCEPVSCRHGPNISFPFYIQAKQEPKCGYPGFALNCSEQGFPVVHIAENEYIVEDISYQTHTFHLQNTVFNRTVNGCVSQIKNVSLDNSPFKFLSDKRRIYLLSKCKNESLPETLLKYKIGCVEKNTNDWGLAMFAEDDSFASALRVCNNHVMVPVEMVGDEGISNQVVDYQLILRRGFRLKWIATNCTECALSDGRCGFDESHYQFQCFCPDRPHSDSCNMSKSRRLRVALPTTIAITLLLCSIIYLFYRARRTSRNGNPQLPWKTTENGEHDITNEDDEKGINVPFFCFESILAATDNFSDENMLGRGGFGPVYKGKFQGGREIAIKRLSAQSGQGIDEFKNEVVLIARLQHRNLVRLLGYCIQGNEKILLYEYMPNKSLDTFIFKGRYRALLDWRKRIDIISGIARGLLYLHHDSRLRIIHRDLKTSNILLDRDMNPKISDFGLARIVQGNNTEANTNRIVGTYGYMSPEYALDGLFSTKSDVFSFGVVMLEIICGKRNTGFYQREEALNLLGYAWRLWNEENAMTLVDESLLESCNNEDASKFINIALLCVQEDAGIRPSMPDVIIMLGSDSINLPKPSKPAFIARTHTCSTTTPSFGKSYVNSNNELTVTLEQGR